MDEFQLEDIIVGQQNLHFVMSFADNRIELRHEILVIGLAVV